VADRLIVRGAREHNLQDVSVDLPRNALIVFTGLSGSGKSSLAFDTIFAEGQRRYVESLSAYARQFLGQLDKPDVDFIEGLSPAVSIDQKSTSRNPRSTVGTITEVYDYLRLLYARIGHPHCPVCGRLIARQSPQQIVDRILELELGSRFQVLAPVIRERKGEYGELFRQLQAQGYSRARIDGTVHALIEAPTLKKQEKHTIEVVVDRLAVKTVARRRLTDSIETALRLSGGLVTLDFVDLPEDDPHRERIFSEHLACLYDDLSFEQLEPRSFSFNSPFGACPDCTGLGTRLEVDPELVIPDPGRPAMSANTSYACSRRLRANSVSIWTRRGRNCRPRSSAQFSTVMTTKCTSVTRTGSDECVVITPASKGSCPSSRDGIRSLRATRRANAMRVTCARCRVRHVRVSGSSRWCSP
jgi:excinuclease ABC subunit A